MMLHLSQIPINAANGITGMCLTNSMISESISRVNPSSCAPRARRPSGSSRSFAAHPWNTRLDERRMLEEVHMPSAPRSRVMDRAVGNRAGRTGEPRPLGEQDMNRQPLGFNPNIAPGDRPGRTNVQSGFEELDRVHGRTI